MLFTLFGCLDGGKLGHDLLVLFSTVGRSKMEFVKNKFLDVLTIHKDPISYANDVLDLHVFFSLYMAFGGGMGFYLNDFVISYLIERLCLFPRRGVLPIRNTIF